MIDVVVGTVAIVGFGVYIHHTKRKVDSTFAKIEKSWEGNLLNFVNRNGLRGIDLNFLDSSDIKKKSNAVETIDFIGSNISKGYDFIDSTFEKGYTFGPHT